MSRRWLGPEAASDIGRLDDEAIARVEAEAWPDPANADELHDALVWLGFLSAAEAREASGWSEWLAELARDKRVALLSPMRSVTPAQAKDQKVQDSPKAVMAGLDPAIHAADVTS